MYLSGLQGHGTSAAPGARGMPTLCTQGTTRFSSRSMAASTGAPMRAMIRVLTTTYGESVSCTPICDIGEPTEPMLNASTYIVRPAIAPLNFSFRVRRISYGLTQLLVGPAASLDSEHTNVRCSTRATSLASDRPRGGSTPASSRPSATGGYFLREGLTDRATEKFQPDHSYDFTAVWALCQFRCSYSTADVTPRVTRSPGSRSRACRPRRTPSRSGQSARERCRCPGRPG